MAISFRIQFGDRLYGLKLSSRAEIDFAVKVGDAVYPIECKSSLKFKKNYLKSLQEYLARFSPKGKGFLFYAGLPLTDPVGSVHVLPFYLADEVSRLIGANP